MKLRVLIADDELLSRERLRHFLRSDSQIEIVAECANGKETAKAIRENSPDLVFLDIKMPELDGFGVLEALSGARLPAIIFVTAHDQFAVRAFEEHAVDYLLKPFDHPRFQTALQRARKRLQNASSVSELLTRFASRSKPLDRVTVKSGDRIQLVNVAEIDWICAADNYVELHVGNTVHLLRMTITALAGQLPQNQFMRISRSAMVNSECIKEIRCKAHGDYVVLLHNGTALTGTRTFRRNLAGLLG